MKARIYAAPAVKGLKTSIVVLRALRVNTTILQTRMVIQHSTLQLLGPLYTNIHKMSCKCVGSADHIIKLNSGQN